MGDTGKERIDMWEREQEIKNKGFPGGSVVKNLPASAGDLGLIPGLGRSLEKEKTTQSGILAREIPRTGKPVWLQSMGSQKSQTRLSD